MIRSAPLCLLLVASLAMGDAIDDPWAEIPELPNSCFQNSDDFIERLDATSEAFAAAEASQNEINSVAEQAFRTMDLMEQQQRMMTFLSEHPEQAQGFMETLSGLGQANVDQTLGLSDELIQLQTGQDELVARYEAELQQALAPSQALYQDWVDRYWTENAPESEGRERVAGINAAYTGSCASWWNQGPFHDHLARLRESEKKWVGQQADARQQRLQAFEIMGISTEGYRSTDAIRVAQQYLRQVRNVFTQRWLAPLEYSTPI